MAMIDKLNTTLRVTPGSTQLPGLLPFLGPIILPVFPPAGFYDVPAHLVVQPSRPRKSIVRNTSVAGHPNNFLYHVDIGLAFCSILVARDPGNKFHMLMHFYWNIRWEQMFTVDGSG